MKPSEFLIKAKSLIDTPEKWTTGSLARDKYGKTELYTEENAVCFCSFGALMCVRDKLNEEHIGVISGYPYDKVEFDARLVLFGVIGDISEFNDHNPHDVVMKKWDEAIALAIQKEEQ